MHKELHITADLHNENISVAKTEDETQQHKK